MSEPIIEELLAAIPDGELGDIRVGTFWTAAVVEVDGASHCGLASNLYRAGHCHTEGPSVPDAGKLLERTARELAGLARSGSLVEASIGMATINALARASAEPFSTANAEEVLVEHGRAKRVAMVGSFPFVSRLRESASSLEVIDDMAGDGSLLSAQAAEVIPQADLVAITGSALINHTFDGLLALCRPSSTVMVVGPSTPLSPVMFDRGVEFVAGAVVENLPAVLEAVSQGGNFRQVRRRGVRLVTMQREPTGSN